MKHELIELAITWHLRGVHVMVKLCSLNHFPNLSTNSRHFLWIQSHHSCILIEKLLQFCQIPVSFSSCHRRYEMVNDDRMAAAFCLSSLTWIVDDKRIDQREIPKNCIRSALCRKAKPFAWQPFQSSVLAQMNHRIGAESLVHPPICG